MAEAAELMTTKDELVKDVTATIFTSHATSGEIVDWAVEHLTRLADLKGWLVTVQTEPSCASCGHLRSVHQAGQDTNLDCECCSWEAVDTLAWMKPWTRTTIDSGWKEVTS